MDVRMPLLDGIEATRAVLRTVDSPPKIRGDHLRERRVRLPGAAGGADGFLLKRARPSEIVHAVRLVAEGETLLFPAAVRALAAEYGNRQARAVLERAALTEREEAVLRLMARGLTNVEIAAELIIGTETVKSHVSAILAKLGARDRTQAVITAYESGFVSRMREGLLPADGGCFSPTHRAGSTIRLTSSLPGRTHVGAADRRGPLCSGGSIPPWCCAHCGRPDRRPSPTSHG